jgi:phage shock protein PspC (stress-responsive transcriptional regulator)
MTVYCPVCGTPNDDFAQFCLNCGSDLSEVREKKAKQNQAKHTQSTSSSKQTISTSSSSSSTYKSKKLYRSRDDKVLTGLSAGLADYLDMDVGIVRLLWILATLFTSGIVIVAYFVLAAVTPLEPVTDENSKKS